jgi:hypothetical protein
MSARLRAAAAVALAAVAVGATSTAADAAPKGGGSAKVTCAAPGGVKADPGDEMTTTTYIMNDRGKVVGKTVTKQICGDDGNWHEVARIVTGTVRAASGTVATTRSVVR